ncbi:expressed unknown protein [Seminavis robusta]|uniref:Uncharacterized protein n=1 Tax=Seminavis robusta TaxID=568900 RepID=A0A9N8EZV6_9STRA|nr:expressed unknown protein [Seminavis robusta]|eukprot:Sro3263_g345990.1 n/a (219) ;mRNA; f:5998-6654
MQFKQLVYDNVVLGGHKGCFVLKARGFRFNPQGIDTDVLRFRWTEVKQVMSKRSEKSGKCLLRIQLEKDEDKLTFTVADRTVLLQMKRQVQDMIALHSQTKHDDDIAQDQNGLERSKFDSDLSVTSDTSCSDSGRADEQPTLSKIEDCGNMNANSRHRNLAKHKQGQSNPEIPTSVVLEEDKRTNASPPKRQFFSNTQRSNRDSFRPKGTRKFVFTAE